MSGNGLCDGGRSRILRPRVANLQRIYYFVTRHDSIGGSELGEFLIALTCMGLHLCDDVNDDAGRGGLTTQ